MKGRAFILYGFLALVLGVAGFLAACGPAPKPTPTPTATPRPVATPTAVAATPTPTGAPAVGKYTKVDLIVPGKRGGTLRSWAFADPASFDPQREASVVSVGPVVMAYNPLVALNPFNRREFEPSLSLAESWSLSADGTLYTFKIRQGVKFHDGKPLTAEDVRYSLWRILDPASGVPVARRAEMGAVNPVVKVVDNRTVTLNVDTPSAPLLTYLTLMFHVILPKHVIEEKGDMKTTVLGTGPFKFVSYTRGVSVEFEKNLEYWRPGKPFLDGVQWVILKDGATRVAATQAGRVEGNMHIANYTIPELAALKKDMGDQIVVGMYPPDGFNELVINHQKAPWNDIRVRRALNLAIDREAERRWHGGHRLNATLGNLLPPWQVGAFTEAELLKLPGWGIPKPASDREEAKRLLREAGVPDGYKTTILTAQYVGVAAELPVFLVDQLRQIGLDVTLEQVEVAQIFERMLKGNYDLSAYTFSLATTEPSERLAFNVTGGARNYSLYSNAEWDRLYAAQNKEVDPAKRAQIIRQLEQKHAEELPFIATGTWGSNAPVYRSYVKGVQIDENSPYQYNQFPWDWVWLDK